MSDLKPTVFLPKPGSIHAETINERKVLLAHAQDDSELLVVWCRRHSTGGFYHAPTKTWALYSGAGFSLSDFLDHLVHAGVRLPKESVLTAWCLAVRHEKGTPH
jgi:hypothetical protein